LALEMRSLARCDVSGGSQEDAPGELLLSLAEEADEEDEELELESKKKEGEGSEQQDCRTDPETDRD
jgi:hypothetical protein